MKACQANKCKEEFGYDGQKAYIHQASHCSPTKCWWLFSYSLVLPYWWLHLASFSICYDFSGDWNVMLTDERVRSLNFPSSTSLQFKSKCKVLSPPVSSLLQCALSSGVLSPLVSSLLQCPHSSSVLSPPVSGCLRWSSPLTTNEQQQTAALL